MNTITKQCDSLLEESDLLASLCNVVALCYHETKDINWLGLYFYKNNELILGPFQGLTACTHIKIGNGVCGNSFQNQKILNVKNVHEFKGHIACDSASNSELVLPLLYEDNCYGVLDIDSPIYNRFSQHDETTFQEIAYKIAKKISNYSPL